LLMSRLQEPKIGLSGWCETGCQSRHTR